METCGQKCLKWLMFAFNFLFFLCGAALLGVGIWVLIDGSSFAAAVASDPLIFSAVYVIIAVGAALMVICFLGCCGAVKENRCLLGTFFTIVLLIVIVEIVGGILAFAYWSQISEELVASMGRYNGNETGDSTVTEGWDILHRTFDCCGFNGPLAWVTLNERFPGPNNELVPESCCTRDGEGADAPIRNVTSCVTLENDDYYYPKSCDEMIVPFYWTLGGTAIGVLVVEILALVFSCCLYCAIGKEL